MSVGRAFFLRFRSLGSIRRSPWVRYTLWLMFCLQFVGLDLVLRGTRPWLNQPALLLSAMQSGSLWALVSLLTSRSRGLRILAASLAASLFVLQCLFFLHFGTLMDAEVVRSTVRFWADVKPTLVPFLPRLTFIAIAGTIIEFLWLREACANTSRSR